MSLPDDDDLLRHARSGMTPDDDERAKMRARLLSSVAAVGAAGAAGGAASSAAASAATGIGATTKLLLLALGVSAVGGIGYVATRGDEPTPPARTEGRVRAERAPADRALAADPTGTELVVGGADEVAPDEEQEAMPADPTGTELVVSGADEATPHEDGDEPVAMEPDAPPAESVAPASSPASPTNPARTAGAASVRTPRAVAEPALDPAPDALAEESALIRRARAALQRGDAEESLRALEAHAARYPDGFLAEERDVQRVRALCRQGDVERAERLAARFLSTHPSSMHTPAMRAPCATTAERNRSGAQP